MIRRFISTAFNRSQQLHHTASIPQFARISVHVPSTRFYTEGKPSKASFIDRSEVESRVISIVQRHDKVVGAKVAPNASFVKDLGLDSLDAAEIVMAVEDEFSIQIPDEDAFKFLSIPEVVEYVATHPMAK